MGFMDGLKALVTKGPSGLVDHAMKDQLNWSDRYNAADKSDPVVMKALMEEQRVSMMAKMDKFGTSAFLPSDMKERVNQIYANAGENSAAMHQLLEAQKNKTAAEEQARNMPPAGANGLL